MLTTIALQHLRASHNLHPIDAKWFGIVYRYWARYESRNWNEVPTTFLHMPDSKHFFKNANLKAVTIDEIFRGYKKFHMFQRGKAIVKKILKNK